jgi:hypothetical protein
MIALHPEILRKDGKEQFVVLTWEEFSAVREMLEDLDDLRAIDEAKREDEGDPGLSTEQVRERLGL